MAELTGLGQPLDEEGPTLKGLGAPLDENNIPHTELGKGAGAAKYSFLSGSSQYAAEFAGAIGYPETKEGLLQAYHHYEAEAQKRAPSVGRIEDIQDLDTFTKWLSYNAGQALAYGGVGAAELGLAVGATAAGVPAAIAGTIAAGTVALGLFPSFAGGALQRQEQEGQKPDLLKASGAGALESAIFAAFGPLGAPVRGMIFKQTEEQIKRQLGRNLAERVGASTARGMIEQTGAMAAIDAINQVQAGADISSPQGLSELINSAATGATMGLMTGWVGGMRKPRYEEAPPTPRVAPDESIVQDIQGARDYLVRGAELSDYQSPYVKLLKDNFAGNIADDELVRRTDYWAKVENDQRAREEQYWGDTDKWLKRRTDELPPYIEDKSEGYRRKFNRTPDVDLVDKWSDKWHEENPAPTMTQSEVGERLSASRQETAKYQEDYRGTNDEQLRGIYNKVLGNVAVGEGERLTYLDIYKRIREEQLPEDRTDARSIGSQARALFRTFKERGLISPDGTILEPDIMQKRARAVDNAALAEKDARIASIEASQPMRGERRAREVELGNDPVAAGQEKIAAQMATQKLVHEAKKTLGITGAPNPSADIPMAVHDHIAAHPQGEQISLPVLQRIYEGSGTPRARNFVMDDLNHLADIGLVERGSYYTNKAGDRAFTPKKDGPDYRRPESGPSAPGPTETSTNYPYMKKPGAGGSRVEIGTPKSPLFGVPQEERPLLAAKTTYVNSPKGIQPKPQASIRLGDETLGPIDHAAAKEAQDIVNKVLGGQAGRVSFVHELGPELAAKFNPQPGERLGGVTFKGMAQIMYAPDMAQVAAHEAFHIADQLHLIPKDFREMTTKSMPELQNLIAKAIEAGNISLASTRPELMRTPEEIGAHAVQAVLTLRARDLDSLPFGLGRVLLKIKDFFHDMKMAFTFKGYTNAEDVVRDFVRGKFKDTTLGGETISEGQALAHIVNAGQEILDTLKTPRARMAHEIGWWGRTINTIAHLAQVNPAISRLYSEARAMPNSVGRFNNIQVKALEPLIKMDKEVVGKALSAAHVARIGNKRWAPGEVVKNGTGEDFSHLKNGESLEMTPDIYAAYKHVLDWNDARIKESYDSYLMPKLRQMGYDLKDGSTWKEIALLRPTKENSVKLGELKDVARSLNDLRNSTYIPRSRFGNWFVSVTGPKGEKINTKFFDVEGLRGRIGTAAMNLHYLEMQKKYPEAQGYKVGAPRESTLDDIARHVGGNFLESIDHMSLLMNDRLRGDFEAFMDKHRQSFSEATKPGFLRHTEFVPGFDDNYMRSLQTNSQNFSHWLANRIHLPDIKQAAIDLPEGTAQSTRRFAQEYVDYLQKPSGEFNRLKAVAYTYMLSDVASAAMNLFQGIPGAAYLAQWGGVGALGHTAWGYKEAIKGIDFIWTNRNNDSGFKAGYFENKFGAEMPFLEKHLAENVLGPRLTSSILKEMGYGNDLVGAGSNFLSKVAQFLGKPFAMTESINRIAIYLAAHRTLANDIALAKAVKHLSEHNPLFKVELEKLGAEPSKAALKDLIAMQAVNETQFEYGKESRPGIMRNRWGSVALQFQNYPIQMLELQKRMLLNYGAPGKAALALLLGGMAATSGFWGLPMMENTKDLIQMAYNQATGMRINLDHELKNAIHEATGSEEVGWAVMRGALQYSGGDLGRRIGLGSVPMVQQAMALLGYGSAAQGLQAPALSILQMPIEAAKAINQGRPWQTAASKMLPNVMAHPLEAVAWAREGVRTGKGGPLIPPEKISTEDRLIRGLTGVTPTTVARTREERRAILDAKDPAKDLRDLTYKRLARLDADLERANRAADNDRAASVRAEISDLMADVKDHNKGAAPEAKIKISTSTRRKNKQEELKGLEATMKQMPKKTRSAMKEIRGLYE